MIKVVTFLGNPGEEFAQTRHNISWMMADCCEPLKNLAWLKKFKGVYAVQIYNGEKIYFLKPHEFMNKSGESVQYLLHFFKIKPENLLIVHDDIELDFGWIALKKGGGLGGHNGLRSIAQRLGTHDFYRLRLGISKPDEDDELTPYVLGKFNPEEKEQLLDFLQKSVQALEYILNRGKETAIKKYKKVNLLK
ncbi:aminoacyl-tRNA hydrolase [candidate division KSB1 bacterium]|nr:aminoacyl-tRNA hydrolase [candidate division KSB1 bacterium]